MHGHKLDKTNKKGLGGNIWENLSLELVLDNIKKLLPILLGVMLFWLAEKCNILKMETSKILIFTDKP